MNGTFRLSIELGNDAMSDGISIARALRDVSDRIEEHGASSGPGRIVDLNGNACGSWGVKPEPRTRPARRIRIGKGAKS